MLFPINKHKYIRVLMFKYCAQTPKGKNFSLQHLFFWNFFNVSSSDNVQFGLIHSFVITSLPEV